MRTVFIPLCLLLSANVWAENCGSITKDGVVHPISCDVARPVSASNSNARCSATISFNGKTQHFNHHCTPKTPKTVPAAVLEPAGSFKTRQSQYKSMINELAAKHGVEAALVHAVISVESAYRADVVSSKGAVGLMQLMPTTAFALNVEDSFDAKENIDGGIRYLKAQLTRFDNKTDLALAAYNAGPQAVVNYHHTIPPFRETQHYVKRVKKYRDHYRSDWQKYIL